jgi:hypothetical protein
MPREVMLDAVRRHYDAGLKAVQIAAPDAEQLAHFDHSVPTGDSLPP